MRNTLQEQYNLIKEGKGAKDVFTKHAKQLFPHLIPNHYGFDNASQILTQRGIISENLWGVATGNNEQPDWFSIFNESLEVNTKADAKTPAKEVEKTEEKSYNNQYGAETGDDVIFDQYLNGIQIETCNPKNADKTVDELKKIVLKNLKKDKLYYTKNAAFGIEGIGYTDDLPGLGTPKEVKGKYASSGMEPVKINEGFNEDKMNIQESKLRTAIRQLIKEELNLKEIDQIGEEAQKMAKSKKIDDEVNKRKKKLKALETLKELEADSVNPGKIKELYKEIKTLEKLKEKLEKKGKKKEQIVDETAVVSSETTPEEADALVKTGDTTSAAVKAAVSQAKLTNKPVTVS